MRLRHSRRVAPGVGMAERLAAILVVVSLLLLAGCGSSPTTTTEETSIMLPAEPTAQQVVDCAVAWIEADDCQAIVSSDSDPAAKPWAYQKGGRAAVGYGGAFIINGTSLYIVAGRVIPLPNAERTGVARYIEVSPTAFPSKGSVQETAGQVFAACQIALLTEPYRAVKGMRADGAVARSEDGTRLTVKGELAVQDIVPAFLGEDGAKWAAELGMLPPYVVPVTLVVDQSGRPLDTEVGYFQDPSACTLRFQWVRGLWRPAQEHTMSVQEYNQAVKGE